MRLFWVIFQHYDEEEIILSESLDFSILQSCKNNDGKWP